MNRKLEMVTYISNFIPELGFLTDKKDKFLEITHPLAELAAEKLLNYENNDYLPGYIQVVYNNKIILSEEESTGELLETWADLSYFIEDHASKEKYHIELLDNLNKLDLVKKDDGYVFEVKKFDIVEDSEVIQSSVIPTRQLLDAIFKGYKGFIHFCVEKELIFSEESLLHSSIETLKKLESENRRI
ncbi:hypothetical protein [Bacillus sp. REN10]|uniref:hypothetical protein n=1 Tax=Bacillus sp. REN10 TaxID=2782541 RepID=UPI00193B4AD6|nr:hypothetical protein [Bacillus sp. REN10]